MVLVLYSVPPPYFVQKVGDKRRAVTKFSILVLLAGYRVSRHDSNSGRLITSPSMVFLSGAGATFQMPTLCNPHRTRIAPSEGKRQLSCLSAFNLPITLELAEHSQLGLAMHTWSATFDFYVIHDQIETLNEKLEAVLDVTWSLRASFLDV